MITKTKLRLFPAKEGILEYYSPHMILNKRNWDYKKHFQYGFGSYVQESPVNKKKNMNLARTVDAIYLRRTTHIQGGHKLMYLSTDRLIARPEFYAYVMTKIFIKVIEKLSE